MLRLTVPLRADVTILVDPARSGGAVASGLLSLPPGSAVPAHRLLDREELLFVYKGQGRATVEGRSMTVVPGTAVYVPRQAWQSLRNTGTGLLQVLWIASPPGLERLFRALAQASAASNPAALQALLAEHGVELMPEGQAPPAEAVPARHGRRRHRGRGRRGGAGAPQAAAPLQPVAPVASAPSSAPAAVPSGQAATAGGGRRRRRRRGRGHGKGAGQPPAAASPAAPQPSAQPGSKPAGKPRRERGGRERHRRGHVKEVYMGGKWVRVVGEGPVIAQGSSPTDEPQDA